MGPILVMCSYSSTCSVHVHVPWFPLATRFEIFWVSCVDHVITWNTDRTKAPQSSDDVQYFFPQTQQPSHFVFSSTPHSALNMWPASTCASLPATSVRSIFLKRIARWTIAVLDACATPLTRHKIVCFARMIDRLLQKRRNLVVVT